MGLAKLVAVALISRGAVIKPGDKVALELRPSFLREVREAFKGTRLWNRLYDLHKEVQRGNNSSPRFPDCYFPKVNSYFPEVRLKPEVGRLTETIALHLKEKRIIASPDERKFIEDFLVPHLEPKISGRVSGDDNICLCLALKNDLLAVVRARVCGVIDAYLSTLGS
jgi:hypothetical protein